MCSSLFFFAFYLVAIPAMTAAFDSNNIDLRRNCLVRCFAKCKKNGHQIECAPKCLRLFAEKYCDEEQCLNLRCKDLGPIIEEPPLPPEAITASYDENFHLNVRWEAAASADFYIVNYISTNRNTQIPNEYFVTKTELLQHKIPHALLCDEIELRVASASLAGGHGSFSSAVVLKYVSPNVSLAVESLTLENKPYMKDGYESNETVRVTLRYQIDNWIHDTNDIEVKPLFIIHNCKDPDLSSAVPEAILVENTAKKTFETELASTLMYRRCLFVASFENVHSKMCKRDYSVIQRPMSIALNCNTVTNCKRTGTTYKSPICGRTENFTVGVVNAKEVDWEDPKAPLTVNITFDYNNNIRQPLRPLYYIARYGNAVEDDNIEENVLLGVSLINELGISSNCLRIQNDGTCGEYLPWNNSILISNLTSDTLYGVVICAILDPRNLTTPPIIRTPRYRRIRTDSVMIRASDYRTASVWRNFSWPTAATASMILFFLVVIIGFCMWSRRQQAELTRKKLSIINARQQYNERYTELPKKVDMWELERRNLIIYDDKRLGAGAFGAVFLGRLIGLAKGSKDAQSALGANLMRADNCDVAVKMIPEYADELSKSEFLREIALMKSLGYHERLVNMLACVTYSEPYCLVVEFCSDGDLLRFLRQRCEYMLKLDENGIDYTDLTSGTDKFNSDMIVMMRQLLQFAVQISYGLEYLSQKGFVHRDVAARNILVHDRQYAKIGDFGLCRYVYAQTSNYKGNGGRLPVKWMSPEAIRDYEFTTKSDVWSFGVLMFEIITLGGTPYPGIQPNDILEYLESEKRLAKPDNCPDDIYEIMRLCWASQPSKRPEFATIRRQLALQLEATTDEYSYLRLDAQKDYYNVTKEERLQQAGVDVSDVPSDIDVSFC